MGRKLVIILMLIQTSAWAVVEFSASYYYTKQEYPNTDTTVDDDVSVTRTYTGSFAWYVFSTTAIEVFYSSNEDLTIDNNVNLDDSSNGKTINTLKSTLMTDSLGVGIRQALAPRKSRFLPTISIGHSSQTQQTIFKYVYTDSTSGEVKSGEVEDDVSYVTLALRVRITELLGLRASVTGTYSDFDFSEEAEQVKYSAGLSWIF
jgi:hypothetical protein